MEYVIAIPTYMRYTVKTLIYLERESVPLEFITLFVADEIEYEKYIIAYPAYRVVIGVLGIGPQRNFITAHYPEGTYIVSMDDDIRNLHHMSGEPFCQWIQTCLTHMRDTNIGLLGISPTTNIYWRSISKAPLFQSGRYLCVGVFHIYRNRHNITLDFLFIEDYERSIKYLLEDGLVVRYNGVVMAHTNWACGGLKSARTAEAYCYNVNSLVARYPDHLYITMKNIPALSKTELLPNIRIKKGKPF
jgi:hypothetical protein